MMTDECMGTNSAMPTAAATIREDITTNLNGAADNIDAAKTEDKPKKSKTNNGINNNNDLKTDKTYETPKNFARMPTERFAREYNMNHKYRGHALIFNHELFDIPTLKPRNGTNVDSQNLQDVLKQLDFDVSEHKDYKLRDILKTIDKISAKDHTHNDCLVIAVLSHGEHGYIYAKDVQYKLDNISHYFTANNCPTLAGKPKLFFVQACRGDHFDPGVLMKSRTETDGDGDNNYKIPIHADFLFAYSTTPGFYSWRNTENGSWFIQSLVEELKLNGTKYDVLTLMTFVNQRVALDFESNVPSSPIMHLQKQVSCVTTMLTRMLRFTEKNRKGG